MEGIETVRVGHKPLCLPFIASIRVSLCADRALGNGQAAGRQRMLQSLGFRRGLGKNWTSTSTELNWRDSENNTELHCEGAAVFAGHLAEMQTWSAWKTAKEKETIIAQGKWARQKL